MRIKKKNIVAYYVQYSLFTMRTQYCLLIILWQLSCVFTLSNRAGITVVSYEEILLMEVKEYFNLLQTPLIIIDSPMVNWTLAQNLTNIFSDKFEIPCTKQIANCLCIEKQKNDSADNISCADIASTFLYTKETKHYAHWRPFEGTYSSTKYQKCTHQSTGSIPLITVYNIVNSCGVPISPAYEYDQDKKKYTTFYSYLKVLSVDSSNGAAAEHTVVADVDESIQDKMFEHIDLFPYFELFSIEPELIIDMHIWFGMHYYKAVRHYDESNNLFFMLKGSRRFMLSPPTHHNIFTLYPLSHRSSRHEWLNYSNVMNNDYQKQFDTYDIDLFENELLFLPAYWFHQIENNNLSLAFSMWFKSANAVHGREIIDYKLPINPYSASISVSYVDEFLYFIQTLTDKWCSNIKRKYSKSKSNHLKCFENNHSGFLLNKYKKIYPLLDNLNYDTFEWYSIGLDIENILKCTRTGIEDYPVSTKEFKKRTYLCFMFDDYQNKYKKMWHKSIDDIIKMHFKYSNIGIADIQFVKYLETILLSISKDVNILPIWIGFMRL
eukprot:246270_1